MTFEISKALTIFPGSKKMLYVTSPFRRYTWVYIGAPLQIFPTPKLLPAQKLLFTSDLVVVYKCQSRNFGFVVFGCEDKQQSSYVIFDG